MIDVAIIGGGAAGFFAAINIQQKHPRWRVVIFEKSATLLGKVKVSGGGRCNVTHACYDPTELVRYYPRGQRELLSVFKRFSPPDTLRWFEKRGVKIKAESDGRMFPVTDNSETIIHCFLNECRQSGVIIKTREGIKQISKQDTIFQIQTEADNYKARFIVATPGSSDVFWQMLSGLGHTIVPPVPSLFTFNIQHALIEGLQGVSLPDTTIKALLPDEVLRNNGLRQGLFQNGPLLFTHWGLSGPAVLKLSSVGARAMNAMQYRFEIAINFCGKWRTDEVVEKLLQMKQGQAKKQIGNAVPFDMPQRFWQRLLEFTRQNSEMTWADISGNDCRKLATALTDLRLKVNGKSTFKEEFVTAGGVSLKEVDFKTMESKIIPGLYLAGEVLDIDALTGGFNFQAAWSEAWVISESLPSNE